ncbi:MAG: DUF3800 domain-containing protein [Chloroflexota bacterium]|nr:DUF3800 domain-containing protein [Chloroflexota bacterium]
MYISLGRNGGDGRGERCGVKVMYLDESGDHNLNPKKINPLYPVFVLGGVIVDRAYLRTVIAPEIRAFKLRHFGRDDIVLHTVDMGKGRRDYAFLADPALRAYFYADLNATLAVLDYKVVACVIKKPQHIAQYGVNAADPYLYSLDILVERFCRELGGQQDAGIICAERRNPGLDEQLKETWETLLTSGAGTGYAKSAEIDEKIIGLQLKDKRPNLVGLQLADLVITPIGRHVAGMPPKLDEVLWTVVESKLRRVGGTYMGRGLIIRP